MHSDLHTHSIFSDGTWTPAQLVAEAKRLGLVIALTDHNTVAGLPDFLTEAERQGVTGVPGIEFTTEYNGKELHLLGLFIRPEHYAPIEELMGEFNRLKEISNRELVERLNAAGYHIDYADVQKRSPNGNVNRPHVAAELLARGYADSMWNAFETFLGEDKGFYVPARRLHLTDAIRFIRELGALPVLAHPLQELSENELRELLPTAVDAGLIAMEVMHCSYTDERIAIAKQIAKDFGLLPSGGSDFHGAVKEDVSLAVGKGNLSIPLQFYTDLLERSRTL